ncbi:MAG: class A beta-lactamase-related serine hydrolase [Candidatus Eremiobacteraeota bacterium]|nr:class A beta-lactamase-related serine hydrolase [Candidatus Eremiobacteraeota bacterium]
MNIIDRAQFLSGAFAVLALPGTARPALAQQLSEIVAGVPGTVGVYARTMAPGPPLFAHNERVSFPSASTIKVVIMLAAFRAAEHDPSALHAPVRGSSSTVLGLIYPMIRVSDNNAANLLISHLGFDAINRSARAAGMSRTHLRRHFLDYSAIVHHSDNRTTAADLGLLMFHIERGAREGLRTVASPAHCKTMIDILLGQTDREKIVAGLPRGIPVANKTGEIDGVRSDVAIVEPFGDSPYVLTVLTEHLTDYRRGVRGIARISHAVYRSLAGSGL